MSKIQKNNNKNPKRLTSFYFLGLLLAISSALPAYIQSNFLGQFMDIKTVSLFFIIANVFSVAAILLFPGLIKKLTNYFLTKIVLALYLTSLLGLSLATGPNLALISIILFSITSNLIWINMDISIENLSTNELTGKIRTIYFTFINAGWIISPFLTTYLINRGEYTLSFLVAAFLIIPLFLIIIYQGRGTEDKIKYKKESLLNTLKKMWKNKNLRGIFFITFLLQLFYSSAVIYIPIYLFQNLSMGWDVLGIIFSVMLIPFILIEIPAGIIADKYLGEKELLFAGFIILIITLLSFYYIRSSTMWLWLIVLFLSRVGAALVESMKETYFFKIVDVEDVGCINLFRAALPLAYIAGAGVAILTLSFFPLNYLFLFLAIIMLSGLGFTYSIKDTK
ncbi:MAG: MFS transporter [Patescibacteria group bacterium]|jgi:MFS family permease